MEIYGIPRFMWIGARMIVFFLLLYPILGTVPPFREPWGESRALFDVLGCREILAVLCAQWLQMFLSAAFGILLGLVLRSRRQFLWIVGVLLIFDAAWFLWPRGPIEDPRRHEPGSYNDTLERYFPLPGYINPTPGR